MKSDIRPSCPDCGVWEGDEHSETCPRVLSAKLNEIMDAVNKQRHDLTMLVDALHSDKPIQCPARADKPPNPLAGMPGVTFKDVTPHSKDCPNKRCSMCAGTRKITKYPADYEGANYFIDCPECGGTIKSDTIEQVKEWVVQHHSHHVGCDCPSAFVGDKGKTIRQLRAEQERESSCQDKDSPYVNSLALMDFLKELSNG